MLLAKQQRREVITTWV